MRFTLRQMEIVRAVARTGSISDAAKFLGVSQPAISASLKQSAAQAQFPLFRRVQGRVVPTEDALALLPCIDRVFDCAEEVSALAGDLRSGEAGAVRIAATPAIALSVLPEVIRDFNREHSGVRLTIRTMLSKDVVDEVGSGRTDLGLVMSPYEHRGANITDLWPSELVCVTPHGHPLIKEGGADPETLSKYPLISFSRSLPLGQLIDDAFRSRGVDRRIAFEVGPSIMAVQLIEQGLGCAILDPYSTSHYEGGAIATIPFRPATKISAQLVTHTTKPLSRMSILFISALKSAFARVSNTRS